LRSELLQLVFQLRRMTHEERVLRDYSTPTLQWK
jgi:hypothetical protein